MRRQRLKAKTREYIWPLAESSIIDHSRKNTKDQRPIQKDIKTKREGKERERRKTSEGGDGRRIKIKNTTLASFLRLSFLVFTFWKGASVSSFTLLYLLSTVLTLYPSLCTVVRRYE